MNKSESRNTELNVSVIIPARNEAESLKVLLPELLNIIELNEIIVVNDASTDSTKEVCDELNVKVISHPYQRGNGAAIKTGARAACGNILLFMDADGQHKPSSITSLLDEFEHGYDMVIGARDNASQASLPRLVANKVYNSLASYMSGNQILDLTSGFRAVKSDIFKQFLYLLPNGFSYPTTITMALLRSGFHIKYVPIQCEPRIGKSHIKIIKDGVRFLLIIFRVTSLYSPLKIFAPVSFALFSTGLAYYFYTYLMYSRFTNMSILLLLSSVFVFLIGLLSEQVTFLIYSRKE